MNPTQKKLKQKSNERLASDASFNKMSSINRDYYINNLLPLLNDATEAANFKQNPNFDKLLFNILFNIDWSNKESIIPIDVLKRLIDVYPELLTLTNFLGLPENQPGLNSEYKKILHDARINYKPKLVSPTITIPQKQIDNTKQIQIALDLFKQTGNYNKLTYYFSNNGMMVITKQLRDYKIEQYNPGYISVENDKVLNYVKNPNPFVPKVDYVKNINELKFQSGKDVNNLEMITVEGIDYIEGLSVPFKRYLFKDKKINELMSNSFGKRTSISLILKEIKYLLKV